MPEISLHNIDQIINDIRNEEISFSHLPDDLIDHVCCDVEYEMQTGLDFHQAYQRVKQKIGSPRRLREIQEETLYSVDSKYRKMKNTMKFSAIAGTILFGFAALFKIQHWPAAGILLTSGALTLAFVFMPSAIGVLWKETHNKNKLFLYLSGFVTGFLFITGTLFKIQHWPVAGILLLGSVVTAVFMFLPALLSDRLNDKEMSNKRPVYILGTAGAIFYILGMFFKIQHWPAASVLMVLGLIILGLVVLPWYTWLSWKNETNVSAVFIFIVLGSLMIFVPGALININLQSMYENGYYPHMERQHTMFEAQQSAKSSLLAVSQGSPKYQHMKTLDEKTSAVIVFIENIQKQMVEESEGEPGKPVINTSSVIKTAAGYEIDYKHLSKPFHPQPVRDFLAAGSSSRQQIDEMLDGYSEYISTLVPQQDYDRLSLLLDPSAFLPGEEQLKHGMTMMSALHSLEIIKINLTTVESRVLSLLATQ